MRLSALVSVLLFVGLAAAGCVEPDGSDDANDDRPPTDPKVLAGTYAEWTVSDFWHFDMDVRGFTRYSETKLIYYEESGPEFVVGTPNYNEALYHAVFSPNPILGRVHKELLSPHDQGAHAHMFPFHKDDIIDDGEAWTTTFYERQVDLKATYNARIQVPGGTEPGFVIEGKDANSAFTMNYNYVRAMKWFTELRVVDEEGEVLHLKLKEHDTGYKGAAYFIRAKDYLIDEHLRVEGLVPAETTFQVSASDVDRARVESFAIAVDIDLGAGLSATLTVLDPDGTEIYRQSYGDDAVAGENNIKEVWPEGSKSNEPLGERPQWEAGTYRVRLSASGQGSATVDIVGTQDNSGRV